jgi:hypothetical protein
MTVAEPSRSTQAPRRGPDLAGAVRRLDVVAIDPDLARALVFWLGKYADLATQRNGCVPAGLAEVQYAIAEAAVGVGDSRQREESLAAIAETVVLGHDAYVDTATAAAALGCTADTVRWHCRKGNLVSKKSGRQTMVTVASVEDLKVRLDQRKGA